MMKDTLHCAHKSDDDRMQSDRSMQSSWEIGLVLTTDRAHMHVTFGDLSQRSCLYARSSDPQAKA